MLSKILITGGAGFIGSNLIKSLNSKKWDIIVLDALIKQVHPDGVWEVPDNVTFFHGKIQDKDIVKKALNGVDYIVHLAAETGVGQSAYEIARYIDTNEYGTAVVLEQAAKYCPGLKGIILASSRAVYGEGRYSCKKCGDVFPIARTQDDLKSGEWEHSCPICDGVINPVGSIETQPLNPASYYAITKFNQEQLIELFSTTYKIPAISLRFQNVYGPGQSLSNPYTGILSIFSTRILSGNPVLIYEDGNEKRDFVFIDDIVQSICLPLEKGFSNYEVFNVGTDIGTTVFDMATKLVQIMELNVPVDIVGKYRVGDIRHAWADISKIKREYAFKPDVSISNGLKKFVDWVKNQPPQNDGYQHMEDEMHRIGLLKGFC